MDDKKTSHSHECGCGTPDCACGKRNRFFRGKRMKAHDFEIEQAYGIERRRIINRSVIGTGVVNGFAMSTDDADIGPGFALDTHGREIVLADRTALSAKNLFLIAKGASGCRTLPLDQAVAKGRYLLSVHYAERRFGEAASSGNCGCDTPEHNYLCETAVFSLIELDGPCPCGETPCHRTCECWVTDACGKPRQDDEPRDPPKPPEKYPPEKYPPAKTPFEVREVDEWPRPDAADRDRLDLHANRDRGPHACVCHWLMHEPVDCERPPSCHWNGYAIDPADGVALACVTVTTNADECRPVEIEVIDPCGPRDFVKNNDLLYDFLRGCDLTHVSWISWRYWHRQRQPMPWPVFAAAFEKSGGGDDPPPTRTAFAIRFSAPVLRETIRFDSVAIRIVTVDQATDWRLIRRIPILKIDPTPHGTDPMPTGTTNQIRLFVDPHWVRDEIEGSSSWLTWANFDVEFELFGDGILDCHRLALDAEAIGVEAFPSGNGSPGGTYRSSFRVEAKPSHRHSA